jgi:hypothetical protein
MFKWLILCLLFTSCVNEFLPRQKKLGETNRDDIYNSQEADLALGEIQRQTQLSTIPTANEVNEYLNTTLSAKESDCIEDQTFEDSKSNTTNELSPRENLERNFAHLGGDPTSLKQALCFFDKYKGKSFSKKINKKYQGTTKIKNEDYMVIQDFNQPSSKKRLFLLNLKTGHVKTFFSAHGMGTKEGPNNSALMATNFSNAPGTNLSPRGFMVSAERIDGLASGWKWHMKFDGLEKNKNDNSRDRLVVFHQGVSKSGKNRSVWEGSANSDQIDPHLYQRSKSSGKPYTTWAQGMTWGCTAVAPEHADEVYEKTKGGALFYNYTDQEKNAGDSYCGSDPLVKD